MSEPRTHDAHTECSEVWRSVSKVSQNTLQDNKAGRQTFGTTSHVYKDLQSPKHRPCSRYSGLNNADSPGDGEASQDIIWDPMSPPQLNTGRGLRNTRVVEISDIVNRIAPKDAKPVGVESPLLQWIGDSAVPCTPEIPQPRVRKKSSRQSNVEDLMKLARQFDKNMQEDSETSEQLNTNLPECGNTSDTIPTETALPSCVKELRSQFTSDQVEAELHALFDSSTQRVSGRLSQGSSASACSQEIKGQSQTPTIAQPQQSEVKLTDKSDPAAHPAENKGSLGISANKCDEFDDDWENDDLLNDPFVLAMTQNPDQQHNIVPKITLECNTRLNTTHNTSACKPTVNVVSACQASSLHLQPSCSALQELCPKPKTTNRSTFKLEPNPHFQAKVATITEGSKLSAAQSSKSHLTADRKCATTKPASSTTVSTLPHKVTSDQVKLAGVAADIPDRKMKTGFDSDCLWDDGDDDELLYEVCDNVEKISNSQPKQATSTNRQEKHEAARDRLQKTTAPLPIEMTRSINSKTSTTRQSSCAFVRSNSLPGTNCESENYQGWNVPMKGATSKPQMSQSLPGSHVGLGTFSHFRDSSGTFQAAKDKVDTQPHTVTARPPQNSKSHNASFKRNLSDSVALSNKVFVTSQMMGKCSAAEIERKKQEAMARRRQRMQNTPKP